MHVLQLGILQEMKTALQADLLRSKLDFANEKFRLRKLVLDERERVKNMKKDFEVCESFFGSVHAAHAALCDLVLVVQKMAGNEVNACWA